MILRDDRGQTVVLTPRMVEWLRVAASVDEVGADDHTDQRRHDSREAMFKNVDRQIRTRVAQKMPEALAAARIQIETALGVDSICETVREHRRYCDGVIAETRSRFDATIAGLVDDALASIARHQLAELAKRCRRALGAVVAKEVSRQLGRLLKVAATPVAPVRKRGKG